MDLPVMSKVCEVLRLLSFKAKKFPRAILISRPGRVQPDPVEEQIGEREENERNSGFINRSFSNDETYEYKGASLNDYRNEKSASSVHEAVDSREEAIPSRGQWANKTEFILSCIGLSVGIGNIWRFPFLAYQNGGGAFLLPYVILMLLIGKPLYYLELALGQFTSSSVLTLWKCAPAFKGVGYAQLVTATIVAIYYNVIIAYTVFYMAQSFRSELPWASCESWWGADSQCYVRKEGVARCDVERNRLVDLFAARGPVAAGFTITSSTNKTAVVDPMLYNSVMRNCANGTETASQQFWTKHVLGLTESIDNMGSIRWDLAICLAFCWVLVFLCLMKGVKSTGKVVYFTATFPYVVLLCLLIRGLTLDGAREGVLYFLLPDWSRITELQIWRKAAEQLFYSLSVANGAIIMFGSYNEFRNPVHKDAFFISTMDFLTSLIGGIVIFSILGNMSHELGIPIDEVATQGQGLAFVAYPEALSRLVWPQLWSFLFFFMLFLLGLDSEFAMIETLLTSIYDEKPELRKHKTLLTFVVCLACFFLGIPCVMQGGQYVFNLMDTYGGGSAVVYIAIFEVIAIAWVYGLKRICGDFEFMLGHKQSRFWKVSWAFFSPVILIFLFLYGLATHEPLLYDEKIAYPAWAEGLGWSMALMSMVQVPFYLLYALYKYRHDVRLAFRPTKDWGPGNAAEREAYDEILRQQRSPPLEIVPRNH
ncbi:sodium-dependent proline transporter [Galendromus occidentalis]|uniref:Transporter n=1 Tax=Galendromus occidentalis TaxID=34638 RepID=A0AAJ7SHH5_9ACAR|nr:sodium-dependent proline transporter [Galendromus occidentalis]